MGAPIADINPNGDNPDPWLASSELRRILREASADPDLLDDLADVREAELDD